MIAATLLIIVAVVLTGGGAADSKAPVKKSESFVEALVQCLPTTQFCALANHDATTCALHCILDGSNATRNLLHLIPNVAREMCLSSGSVFDQFDQGFQMVLEHGDRLHRLTSFLEDQGANAQTMPQFSHVPMSIPMGLIKYGNSPLFNILKPTILAIQSSFHSSYSFPTPQFTNTLCQKMDHTSSAMILAQTLTLYPHVSDIIIPGYFTLSAMASLRIDALLEPMSALFKTMALLGGVECSMLLYSQTGKSIKNCNEVVGTRYPRYFGPRPQKAVCIQPINAELVDLKKLFPNIKMEETEKLVADEAKAHSVGIDDKAIKDMILPKKA